MHAHQCLHSFLMCLNKLILRHSISSSFIPFGWTKNYCCLLLFFVSSLLSFVVLCMFFVVLCCFFFVLCCQQCLERRHWFSFCSFESLSLDFAQILFPQGNSLFSDWKGQKIWRSGRATMSRQIQCEELVLSQMQTKTFDFQRKWQTNHNVSQILNVDDRNNVLFVFCTKTWQECETALISQY